MTATSAAAGVNRQRHTDAVQLAGVALEAAACRAEGTRGEPLLAPIQGCTQLGAGRPGSTAAPTWAAAGARGWPGGAAVHGRRCGWWIWLAGELLRTLTGSDVSQEAARQLLRGAW